MKFIVLIIGRIFFRNNPKWLARRSAAVVNVFAKTIKDLNETNEEIAAAGTRVNTKIQVLSEKRAQLNETHQKNEQIATKLNSFFTN